MKKEYISTTLFFLIVAIFFYLFYRLMIPFFAPIAWAGILTIVFYPLYTRLYKKVRSSTLASLLTCVLIFIIILGPSIYLLASLVNEATSAVQKVNEAYQEGKLEGLFTPITPFLNIIKNKLNSYPQLADVDFVSIVKDAMGSITKAIGSQATTVIANISKTVFYFLLMLFSMFFFFRDGERTIDFLKRITPLDKAQVTYLYSHFRKVIEGMMYGGVVMALIQGVLGGVLFAIMGISSAVMWGPFPHFRVLHIEKLIVAESDLFHEPEHLLAQLVCRVRPVLGYVCDAKGSSDFSPDTPAWLSISVLNFMR